MQDNDLINEFVEESREHLSDIEVQLVSIEALGENIDDSLVNTVFRAIHSVKGAAGFLGLTQINNVAHSLENILGAVREHKIVPDPYNVDVMLKAADRLCNLIEDIDSSNDTDNKELCEKLDAIFNGETPAAAEATPATDASQSAPDQLDSDSAVEAEASDGPTDDQPPSEQPAAEIEPETDKHAAEKALETAEKQVEKAIDPPKPASTPAAPAAPAAKPAAPQASASRSAPAVESKIRVGIKVLDRLMNLAGELVLSRNQLLRVLSEQGNVSTHLDSIVSGLDQVTTELQESIMQTRMQPIGNVFNKFPRVIRDLATTLGKKIDLRMEGNEVETDKTIVEAIADPLTHLIRNSCDHGIESPEIRQAAGKSPEGTVVLRAFHKAGKVIIEIDDDGAGMDPAKLKSIAIEKGVITEEAAEQLSDADAVNLIFAPGFSTAKAITDVSGRGVGMDVVRTNIEKIGGSVEIESQLGTGSTIRITLPLTLAIVPSMIVSVGDVPFALPQASIVELVQTNGDDKRIECVSNAEVLRLRGELIPLVRLRTILGMETDPEEDHEHASSQLVVVEAGRYHFAVAVDRVLDSEEIVVKPLGRHLSSLPLLAGSTILGDGRVAMILDTAGISNQITNSANPDSGASAKTRDEILDRPVDTQRMVLLSLSQQDRFAVSMDIVSRIERVRSQDIDKVGERLVMQYRGGTLPLVTIDEVIKVQEVDAPKDLYVIVYRVYGREVGLLAPHLDDIRDCELRDVDNTTAEPGIAGLAVIDERTTRILDLYGMTEAARPEWFETSNNPADASDEPSNHEILVCEDSKFFRNFLVQTLNEVGYRTDAYENGEEGWSTIAENPNRYSMLLTDIEMPELDGIELTKRVRADGRFNDLPVVALTSLADEASKEIGRQAGVDDYQVKMNKPELLKSISQLIFKGAKS